MANPPKQVTFLARNSYRQRRLRDAAWLLPIVGALLFSLPLLWPRAPEGADLHRTSEALTFLFSVWLVLIAVAFAVSRLLRPDPSDASPETEG